LIFQEVWGIWMVFLGFLGRIRVVKSLIFQGVVELSTELRMVENEPKCVNGTDMPLPVKQDQFQNVNIPPSKRYTNIVIL